MPTKTSIPPPNNGYWNWVREELRSKANEKWVTSEISALKRMVDDTKVTAVDARKEAGKPYSCSQMKAIEELRDWQRGITNWKIPVIISIVLLILSAAGQYYTLKDSVEDGAEDREMFKETLIEIQKQQQETSKIVSDIQVRNEAKDEELNEELKEFFEELVEDLKDSDRPERPRNRRATAHGR